MHIFLGYFADQQTHKPMHFLRYFRDCSAEQCVTVGLSIGLRPSLMWRELGRLTENWHPSRKKGRTGVFTDATLQPFQHFHPLSSSSSPVLGCCKSAKQFDCFLSVISYCRESLQVQNSLLAWRWCIVSRAEHEGEWEQSPQNRNISDRMRGNAQSRSVFTMPHLLNGFASLQSSWSSLTF